MNDLKKSDPAIVALKPANNGRQRPAEPVEPRVGAEGNPESQSTRRAQKRASVSHAADGIRQAAKRNPDERLVALLHHITVPVLEEAFHSLKRDVAAGVDGVTWKMYAEGLEDRLVDLHARIHSGAYRAPPVRRVEIPKPDGGKRPLGIASLEDKVVQKAVTDTILVPIYETEFLGFSYGFRPRRGAHNALDALAVGITQRKVNWIVDADIRGFFDNLNRNWLVRFLEHRIGDKRVIRLITKWLNAGVMEGADWTDTGRGSPQGAIVSPVLANAYLHYVLDLWVHKSWRKRKVEGDMIIVRYADDFVTGFQHRWEAQRFLNDLRERLALPFSSFSDWTQPNFSCIRSGMMIQKQINRSLNAPAARVRLKQILAQSNGASRSAIGRRVCEVFDFADERGRLQLSGCMKALRALEGAGEIQLPAARCAAPPSAPRRLARALPAAVAVPATVSAVADLAIVLVETDEQRRAWSTLIAEEHPRGMTTFAGCQLRYLVTSAHGWLAAVGFSASALRLASRERWMGWSDEQRKGHLNRVLCMSRFLIRPSVSCTHLASYVLGRVLRRLARDFEARYGYRPWLVETFVEPPQEGVSLRAANFLYLGQTAGRGRQDRHNRHAETRKSVYIYQLAPDWRRRLGVPFVDHAPVLVPGDGLDSERWARMEFGGAPLGDKRLTARLVRSAELLAAYPGRAMCGTAKTDRQAVDGYYRFIEQPQESAVTVENILKPHRARSIQRMRSQRTVLAIQDGTDLNFARRPNCEGLGIIGKNQTSAKTLGLHLHLTLAVNGEGLPLGVLRCGFEAPTPKKTGTKDGQRTQRWLDGFKDIAGASRELTGSTRVISVMDREADFFELFDTQRRTRRVEILVRAKHDRCLEGTDEKLFAKMRKGDAGGIADVAVERLTERKKTSGKKARPARSKRLARCEIRYRRLMLPATIKTLEPVQLSAVHIIETEPPEGEEAVQWYLLTSLPIDSFDAAREVIAFYLQRWRVEDYFRVLKSGCRVEHLAFRTADRLQRAIAINSVVAWRIMLMTLLGRQVPDCDPGLMFTNHELSFLRNYALEYKLPAPDGLGAAARLVAILGGYMNRKHDPDPGNQIMWRGYERLSAATLGHRIAEKHGTGNACVL